MMNAEFKHRGAEFVWVLPTAILAYKLLTFTAPSSVLVQYSSWPAFHHYFDGGFLIPETQNWKDLWKVVGSNSDTARGLDQFNFTTPFYAGMAYSITACIGMRTNFKRRLTDAYDNWEERRFDSAQESD